MEAKEIYLLAVFSFLSITYASIIVFSSITPLGVDWNNFHLKAVEAYAKGDISYLSKYPPSFQLLFVPLALLNLIDYVYYFQILFYVLAIVIPVYFVYKMVGYRIAVIVGFLLLASPAYLDRAIQLNPETLQLSLFPLAVLLFSKKRFIAGSLLLLFLGYSSPIGSVFSLIIFAYSFVSKKWQHALYSIVMFGLSAPMISYFQMSSGTVSANALYIYSHPLVSISYFGVFSVILTLPLILWVISKMLEKKHYFSKLCKFCFVWIVVFTPLFFLMIDRWIQYILLPLSILEAIALFDAIEKIRKRKG